jgi:hypothetical protein
MKSGRISNTALTGQEYKDAFLDEIAFAAEQYLNHPEGELLYSQQHG